jgi:hypothetical protein
MLTTQYLLDILKFTIAGAGVIWIAFYLVKPYLDKQNQVQLLELKRSVSSQTLPLRLQAYERVVLFIDRINPANMLIRLNAGGLSAVDLHIVIVNEIRTEFQHNVTQQIYVSSRVWAVMKRVKEDTMSLVNNAIKGLPQNATAMELSKTVLIHLSQLEDDPYEIAINLVRQDLEELF